MDNILVVTGWYSDSERWKQYQGAQRSKLTFEPFWFSDYWIPQIRTFIDPFFYFYISDCEIKPFFYTMEESADQWDNRINILLATKQASSLDHRHGFHAAIMNGLEFALTEHLDFVFIEQDCFVHNLDRIITWAHENIKDKLIIFGYGEYSFAPGWAEQSLIFVPNNRIADVLTILNYYRIHETTGYPMPEELFANWFTTEYMIPWNFGYGRHLVKSWAKDECFYKQQLTDLDINNFIQLRK